MSTGNAQTEGEPIIEADLGDNGGIVAFHTLEEAEEWVDREIKIWDRHRTHEIRSNVALRSTGSTASTTSCNKQITSESCSSPRR